MTPLQPYLLRAYHEWILDNDCTPYIVVDTHQEGVQVPVQFVQPDGQITLNVSPGATGGLSLGEQAIEFSARFSGQVHHVYVPNFAVLAIFAKENGQGTAFAVAPAPATKSEFYDVVAMEEKTEKTKSAEKTAEKTEKKRGHLTIVK